jgi:hypothetical protein
MGAIYESKAEDVMLGGIVPVGDKFQVVFVIHRPCRGGDHKACTVVQRFESQKLHDTREAAIDMVDSCRQDLVEQGITDWKAEGASA